MNKKLRIKAADIGKIKTVRIIFFGSTADSLIVLKKIYRFQTANFKLRIIGAVTQPPRPAGREQIPTPTAIESWARGHRIPVLSFQANKEKQWLYKNENEVVQKLKTLNPDLLINASYGQRIPIEKINAPLGGLNVHPSLLPRWRGGDPVPWTILAGDKETGVTIATITESFDTGRIVSQEKISIPSYVVPDPLRTQLFTKGSRLLIQTLPDYILNQLSYKIPEVQVLRQAQDRFFGYSTPEVEERYGRRFKREDGYIPWAVIRKAMMSENLPKDLRPKILSVADCGLAESIDKAIRALYPWPGVWTIVKLKNSAFSASWKKFPSKADSPLEEKIIEKRLKILKAHLDTLTKTSSPKLVLDLVQLEGKKPTTYTTFSNAYTIL